MVEEVNIANNLDLFEDIIQNIDDHQKTKNTQIHTGPIGGYNLVISGQKLALVRGGRQGTT